MIVNKPVVSSMRSRQTGQVGSSTREGVGGAKGFADSDADERPGDELLAAPRDRVVFDVNAED